MEEKGTNGHEDVDEADKDVGDGENVDEGADGEGEGCRDEGGHEEGHEEDEELVRFHHQACGVEEGGMREGVEEGGMWVVDAALRKQQYGMVVG